MERVERGFRFVNQSDRDVTITSIQSSCGCTTVKLIQRTYAPGEAGQIDVSFEISHRDYLLHN